MKAREVERIRSKFPQWSFESIQFTMDRLAAIMTRSPKPEKRVNAYRTALQWYSREAIGVACRKAGGPHWHGICADCSDLHVIEPINSNPAGGKICLACSKKYCECPVCHGQHHSGVLISMPAGTDHQGQKICKSCFDALYSKCDRCGKVHTKATSLVLTEGGCRCPSCVGEVRECQDCHGKFDARGGGILTVTAAGTSGPWVCRSCISSNWRPCGGCSTGSNVYHRATEECPEGHPEDGGRQVSCIDREGNFRFFNYHGNPFMNQSKTYMNQPVAGAEKITKLGLEMEVEGSFKAQAKALTAVGLTERDVYAERDGTVDVEWVARPMDIETLIPFLRKFVGAIRPVAKAFDSRKTCGCHHNIDRHALSDEGWGKCGIAISKYFKELRKFSGKHRSEGNFPIDNHEGLSPSQMLRSCSSKNKYCAAAFHKPRVVEIRIAGMTLNEASIVTQAKIYSNLVRNAAAKDFDPRGDFVKVFGPMDDEMLEVLYRKEIIPVPPGMEVPEDPERPGRKRRTACALPEGRVLANQWDFIIGDELEVIHPDEMDDRFGRAENLNWGSEMDMFVGCKFKLVSRVRGSGSPEKRKVSVELIGGTKNQQEKYPRYTWMAGMFHMVTAMPPRDPNLRDPYELRVGDVVVLVTDMLPSNMRYLGGAVAEVRGVDMDTVGDRNSAVKIKLLTRVKAPEGVDHLKTSWKYTAGMFRLAAPEERVEVQTLTAYVPEGRTNRYEFKVGDILKFRVREEAKDDLEEAFFEINYAPTLEDLVGCRVQVVEAPKEMPSPLYQDAAYNRVLKVKVIDKADVYAAKVAARPKHAGEDFRFFAGMFEFERPDAANLPPPPVSPHFFRKGERLVFRVVSETPKAAELGYLPHMSYLQGMTVIMESPDAVITPESVITVRLIDPVDQAEHESQLCGLGRGSQDWEYKAGMFQRAELEMPTGSTKETLEAAVATPEATEAEPAVER